MYSSLFCLKYDARSPPEVITVFMPQRSSLNSREGVRFACFLSADEKLMPKTSTSRTMLFASLEISPYSLKWESVFIKKIGGNLELDIVARYAVEKGRTFRIFEARE